MATNNNRKKPAKDTPKQNDKDADQTQEDLKLQSPVLCRQGTLALLIAFRIHEAADKSPADFKKALGTALDDIAPHLNDPNIVKRFRKMLEL